MRASSAGTSAAAAPSRARLSSSIWRPISSSSRSSASVTSTARCLAVCSRRARTSRRAVSDAGSHEESREAAADQSPPPPPPPMPAASIAAAAGGAGSSGEDRAMDSPGKVCSESMVRGLRACEWEVSRTLFPWPLQVTDLRVDSDIGTAQQERSLHERTCCC